MKKIQFQLRFGNKRETPYLPEKLLTDFEDALEEHGYYSTKAEAIRDFIRQYIYYVYQKGKEE